MYATIRAHREEILRLAREHGAYNLRPFGSAARGFSGRASPQLHGLRSENSGVVTSPYRVRIEDSCVGGQNKQSPATRCLTALP